MDKRSHTNEEPHLQAEAINEILLSHPSFTPCLVKGMRVMTVDGALKIIATLSREEMGDSVRRLVRTPRSAPPARSSASSR